MNHRGEASGSPGTFLCGRSPQFRMHSTDEQGVPALPVDDSDPGEEVRPLHVGPQGRVTDGSRTVPRLLREPGVREGTAPSLSPHPHSRRHRLPPGWARGRSYDGTYRISATGGTIVVMDMLPALRADIDLLPARFEGRDVFLVRDPLGIVAPSAALSGEVVPYLPLFNGSSTVDDLQIVMMRRQGGSLVFRSEAERIVGEFSRLGIPPDRGARARRGEGGKDARGGAAPAPR